MSNLFLYADWLAMDSLRILKNKLGIARNFNTDYNKEFTQNFAVGDTVRVKKPQRYLVTTGLGYQPQPIQRKYTTVAVDRIKGIHFEWDMIEKALKMERGKELVRKEYVEPMMTQLAQEIESDAAQWAYQNTNNIVGILGTDATDETISGDARVRLEENACGPGKRGFFVTPKQMNKIVNGGRLVFNPTDTIAKEFRNGYLGYARGFEWDESMSLWSHTSGVIGDITVTKINGAGQSGSSIAITVTAADTYKKGDVVQFAGVNNVNPKTRRSTGTLKQFLVTANFTGIGAGNAADVLQISPAIVGPGDQYQNVDALPADQALITLFPGSSIANGVAKTGTQGLAFQGDAFALVGVKMEIPNAVEFSSQARDPETGLTINIVRAWDQNLYKMTNRSDMLYGFGNLYNDECSVRVLGA